MTAPFLLRVPSGGNNLYSVATATGTVNTHPLTDLIIRNWYKVKGSDVDTVFSGTGALSPLPVAGEINTIEAVLRNILATGLSQVGLTTTFNLISSPFNADGTGFDQVLDNTTVAISPTGQVTLTTFDPTTGMGQTTVSTNISTDLTTPDVSPPSNPELLTARPGGTSKILLGWRASTDNALAGYNIFRDGIKIAAVPYPTYTDSGLAASTNHCYQVEAFDGAGNISAAKSNQACATTNSVVADVGAKFPIATTPEVPSGVDQDAGREISISTAFDGTNYLVGIQGDATAHYNVTAQLMSSSGSLIGSRISTGRTGGAPSVTFNGTNYLMAWSDDANHPNDVIYGQVFNTSGAVVKAPFPISTSVGQFEIGGIDNIVCLNTKCTVMWTDKNSTGTVYGRDIGPTGAFLSSEYTIFSNTTTVGGVDAGAGCDSSSNCLFVTDSGSQILGRIIGPTINKAQFVIATKVQSCNDHNPAGGVFDGTNYLVVWNDHSDCTPVPNWDVMGQRLDASGNLLGTAFKVNSVNTNRAAVPFIAFDGANFLVTWTDQRSDVNKDGICDSGEGTCDDVYGQYVSKTGSLVGSEFVINADAGNQVGAVTGFHAGKYLVILDTGFSKFIPGGAISNDVYGVFVTP